MTGNNSYKTNYIVITKIHNTSSPNEIPNLVWNILKLEGGTSMLQVCWKMEPYPQKLIK